MTKSETRKAKASGLADVVVAETELSSVDGEQGELIIAGDYLENLVGKASFATVCARLWRTSTADAERGLAEGRESAYEIIQSRKFPSGYDSAASIQSVLTQLDLSSCEATVAAARVTGAVAVAVAGGMRGNDDLMKPDASRNHAADMLRLCLGEEPSPARARALESYLVTVSDHGMNASTFTARVVASTGSDMVASVIAAISALKGPLHGGAPGPVLDMLDAIGSIDRAEEWIATQIAAGKRIMGMGHRIYKVRDPRAFVLERVVSDLLATTGMTDRLQLARQVEKVAERILTEHKPDRSLKANVEFYTALLLEGVGFPRTAFTPVFAAGRAAGWTAHFMEQIAVGQLIRPASRYVGPLEPAPKPK